MPDPANPQQGDTYRTRCGGARITYNPEFYGPRPWSVFVYGTAENAFGSFADAVWYLTRHPRHRLGPILRR
jgi:hypothetical protein